MLFYMDDLKHDKDDLIGVIGGFVFDVLYALSDLLFILGGVLFGLDDAFYVYT